MNREPSTVLRPCRFDPLAADVGLEVALDDLGTDDEHLLQYGTDFQKLEDGHSLRATAAGCMAVRRDRARQTKIKMRSSTAHFTKGKIEERKRIQALGKSRKLLRDIE